MIVIKTVARFSVKNVEALEELPQLREIILRHFFGGHRDQILTFSRIVECRLQAGFGHRNRDGALVLRAWLDPDHSLFHEAVGNLLGVLLGGLELCGDPVVGALLCRDVLYRQHEHELTQGHIRRNSGAEPENLVVERKDDREDLLYEKVFYTSTSEMKDNILTK